MAAGGPGAGWRSDLLKFVRRPCARRLGDPPWDRRRDRPAVTASAARPAQSWREALASRGRSCRDRGRALVPDHGGQVIWALTAVASPAVTWAVAMPGWHPARLAMTV